MRKPDVRTILQSPLVTKPTREVLLQRLMKPLPEAPQALTAEEMATFEELARRLLPAIPNVDSRMAAWAFDKRLAEGRGDGWRYDELPSDLTALRFALGWLRENGPLDDALVARLWAEEAEGWPFSTRRWIGDLLAELAYFHYSHPLAQEAIGYVGFADAQGYLKVGLDDREHWEPGETAQIPFGANEEDEGGATPIPEVTADYGDECDVVIVGTGAGGAPLAARLCQAGLRVVALEAGEWWNPRRDFATDERAQEKIFWEDERLSAGANPIGFGPNNSGTGVGGSTLHWTGYTPPLDPRDLRLHTEFGVGQDWPLEYEELMPHLSAARRFLGTSGPFEDDPLPPLLMNAAAKLMRNGCDTLGIPYTRASNAALSRPYEADGIRRLRCTNRGFCQVGCSVGAKGDMDVTYLPLALRHGLDLRPNAFVTRIERTGDQITGVVYSRGGEEARIRCRALFLCAGAVETPRLLLLNEIGNENGQVGRNFMAHTGLQIWGFFEEETRPWKGIPGGLLSEAFRRPEDANFAGGYLLQSIGTMPLTYVGQVARDPGLWGETLGSHMARYLHLAGINMHGECLPHDENYLELSDEPDGRGLPKPRVHFTRHENERNMYAHAEKAMRSIWNAAGATEIWRYPREAHTLGTCRMGTDPALSVVDPSHRVWSMRNLYVCDNSVFPSATSTNPCLTQIALSLRCAERFLSVGTQP